MQARATNNLIACGPVLLLLVFFPPPQAVELLSR